MVAPFRPKIAQSPRTQYHLMGIKESLSWPDCDLRRYALGHHLVMVGRAQPEDRLTPAIARQLALEILSDYGVAIPTEKFIPLPTPGESELLTELRGRLTKTKSTHKKKGKTKKPPNTKQGIIQEIQSILKSLKS